MSLPLALCSARCAPWWTTTASGSRKRSPYAVEALGFSEVPTAGDEFEVYADEKSARAVVGDRASDARATRLAQQMASRRVSLTAMSGQANEGELKELNLILKADVQGSVEAILGSLEQLPKDEVQVRVLLSAPGEITETDVDLAAASGAVIVGFNTSMASGAKKAADATGVDVRDYDVIYKLLEDIQLAMEGLLEPELVEEALGEAEVRAVFTIGKSAVAGCYVTTGKLHRNCKVRVHRGKQVVFDGDLDSLRRNKDDVKEVATGFECGVGTDRFANWEEGDRIEAFKMVPNAANSPPDHHHHRAAPPRAPALASVPSHWRDSVGIAADPGSAGGCGSRPCSPSGTVADLGCSSAGAGSGALETTGGLGVSPGGARPNGSTQQRPTAAQLSPGWGGCQGGFLDPGDRPAAADLVAGRISWPGAGTLSIAGQLKAGGIAPECSRSGVDRLAASATGAGRAAAQWRVQR